MRIKLSYANADKSAVAYHVLSQVNEMLRKADVDLTLNPVNPDGSSDLTFYLWRKEDMTSDLIEISHVHDDCGEDHNVGDSIIGVHSPLSYTELLPVRESDELIEDDDPERFTVNDMLGSDDEAGSLGDALRDREASTLDALNRREASTLDALNHDPESRSEQAAVPSIDELAVERLEDDGGLVLA
jgi:hypothetical protein